MDEREIEAVAEVLAWEFGISERPSQRIIDASAKAVAALDRVRDARGDDEACPACGHEWRRHDPEDGRCDAHSAEPGVFGPCRCGRDVAFTAAANARLSRGALAARSPQGEAHEAEVDRLANDLAGDWRERAERAEADVTMWKTRLVEETARLRESLQAARSPQDKDHEVPCPRCDGKGREGGNTMPASRVCSLCHGTGKQVVRPPQDEDHDAVRQLREVALIIEKWCRRNMPTAYDCASEVIAYLSRVSPSRVGSVAVEDVPPIVIEALEAMKAWTYHPPVTPLIRRKREEIDAALSEFSRSSTGRPEQPEPDVLGSQHE